MIGILRGSHRFVPALSATLLLLGSCQSPSWDTRPWANDDTKAFGEVTQAEWDQLNDIKAELRWRYTEPVRFEFPGQGEVTVRDWKLEGGPGWAYVRAKFTYRNTTDKPMDHVYVVLAVLDEAGNRVAAGRIKLKHPWGLALAPGTFYSDEVQAPTLGAHLDQRGWHWTVECTAVPEEPLADWPDAEQPVAKPAKPAVF